MDIAYAFLDPRSGSPHEPAPSDSGRPAGHRRAAAGRDLRVSFATEDGVVRAVDGV